MGCKMAGKNRAEQRFRDMVSHFARHHPMECPYKVVCIAPAEACPKDPERIPQTISAFRTPTCFIRRPRKWYEEEWIDLRTTSWMEVLSLQKPLLFVLFIIVTVVFFFLVTVLTVIT